MTERFDGKAVIVTGGAAGIGRGIAEAFAAAGAMVLVADVDGAAAERFAVEVVGTGASVKATVGDVSSDEDAARIVAGAVSTFGRLDVLVNNAGIQPIESYVPADELPVAVWDRILAVNLRGAFLMAKYAIQHLKSTKGVIVNISSVQGQQSMRGAAAYSASKSGLLGLTRSLALDHAADGIRVVAVCPGTIDSDMVRRAAVNEGGDPDENIRRYGRIHPLGRIGQSADVAAATLFLASPAASFITGEYVNVDGGVMALGAWSSGAGADRG